MTDWLKPPVFENQEQTRLARLLYITLLIFAIADVVVVTALSLTDGVTPDEGGIFILVAGVGVVLVAVALMVLVRRGLVTLASVIFTTMIWVFITIWTWFFQGLSGDNTYYTYPLVVVMAALLLGESGTLAFTGLSLLALLGAYYAEWQGGLEPQVLPASGTDLLLLMVVTLLIGVLLRYAVRGIASSLEAAQRSNLAQSEARRRLQTMQTSLEQRVRERTEDLEHRSRLLLDAIELGRKAAMQREPDRLLAEMAESMSQQFDCYLVGVYQWDENQRDLVLRTFYVQPGVQDSEEGRAARRSIQERFGAQEPADLARTSPLPAQIRAEEANAVAESAVVRDPRMALERGVPLATMGLDVERVSRSELLTPVWPAESRVAASTRTELALPLLAGDRLLGVIDLHHRERVAFELSDIDVLQLLADQIAVALESAQLVVANQEALEAERRFYQQLSHEGWVRLLRAGLMPGLRYANRDIGPIGDVWYPEMAAAVQQEERVVTGAMDADGETEVGSAVALPLRVRGRTIGVVDLRKRPEDGPWTTVELELVDTLTRQLETALDSARLFLESRQRAERERVISEVSSNVSASLDLETVMKRAAQELRRALDVPQLTIRLTQGMQHEE